MFNNKCQTEYEIENQFIEIIQRNWYSYNSEITDYDKLLINFRNRLNDINKSELQNNPISDDEFKEILCYLERKTIFETSCILRSGKIDIIKRNNRVVYLKLVDLKDINKNKFEVAHQIKINNQESNLGRFDVTLLVNGLPVVQIELKKPGVEINHAFNQIQNYYKKNGYYRGLFNFIQIFVISNEQYTKYFCNNDQEILKSNVFYWSDKENNHIDSLYQFEESFLFCPFLFYLIFNYMIDSSRQHKLFVMRPYQIYALEALKERYKNNQNGYCFHSTGSGKTLTSFKFAFEMSKEPDIGKVFFLVDRCDLDDKTINDFNDYMSSTIDEFTNIRYTKQLVKIINSSQKLIIATIQKMVNALKKHPSDLTKWFNQKIIFIFDECHRSQAGLMRREINKYFKNALFYGFTGTPIFDEKDEKNENVKATVHYFGTPAHTYTLQEAIGDHNILEFCIEYIRTASSKENIKDEIVRDINRPEILMNEQRCQNVVNNILDFFNKKTINRSYNAILACQSIPLLIKHYHLLLKTIKQKELNIKIGAIYSTKDENYQYDDPTMMKNELIKIIQEYNSRPENNTNFSIKNVQAYEREIINNFREKNLDLLLVVDKCLTGMDFVKCNTLYLDKSMRMHKLIQAISRTIRTDHETKICGNIICYQTSKEAMDEALRHFNNNVDVYNKVTLSPIEQLYQEFDDKYSNCIEQFIQYTNKNKSLELQDKFILSFRAFNRVYNKIKIYQEFDISKTKMEKSKYKQLQCTYIELYHQREQNNQSTSVVNDIDFEMEFLTRDYINFDYISNLLDQFQYGEISKTQLLQSCKKNFLLNVYEKSKKKLIEQFLKNFLDTYNGKYQNPKNSYHDFINNQKEQQMNQLSEKYDLDFNELKQIIDNYNFYQDEIKLNRSASDFFKSKFKDINEIINKSNSLVLDIKKYYEQFKEITVF